MPHGEYVIKPKPAPDPEWADQGACHGMDSDLFFPRPSEFQKRQEAIAICHTCPVEAQCLEHALTVIEEHGVWGGKTERQRRDLRRIRHHLKPAKTPKGRPAGRAPKCACGCGEDVGWNKQTGDWYRYAAPGHQRRGKPGTNSKASKAGQKRWLRDRPLPTSIAVELMPLCACGCGQHVKNLVNGIPSQWLPGHHTRLRAPGCQ